MSQSINEYQQTICNMLNQNGLLLKFVPDHQQTEEMCKIAILQNIIAIDFVNKNIKDTLPICNIINTMRKLHNENYGNILDHLDTYCEGL
jgi:hypothetical protein